MFERRDSGAAWFLTPRRFGVDKDKVPAQEEVLDRLATMGINDPNKVYDTDDLAPGKKIIFAATGVTDGALLKGVRFSAQANARIRW